MNDIALVLYPQEIKAHLQTKRFVCIDLATTEKGVNDRLYAVSGLLNPHCVVSNGKVCNLQCGSCQVLSIFFPCYLPTVH